LEQAFEEDARYKKLSHQAHQVSQAATSIFDRMESSASFSEEAALLRKVAESEPTIGAAMSQITDHTARTGVKTMAELQNTFSDLAPKVRRAALMPENGGPIWVGLAYLFDAVKFKQSGQVPGNSVDDVLTRAEYYLRSGDLSTALGEVIEVKGLPAQVMAQWVEAATERLAAEQAIVAIKAHTTCVTAQVV
jgi:mitofilin